MSSRNRVSLDAWYVRATFVALGVHALILGWSATWQSPTLNEPGHLASGIAIWELGRFDTYRVNPPLVRSIAAIPVILTGCKTNWDRLDYGPGIRSEFKIGMDFVSANGLRSIWLFNLARWACIPFSILGGWCCYLWGRALCCKLSGVLACFLWCFNPTVLACGQVIAPDMGGAALGLAASYCFWGWLKRPSWSTAALAGIATGTAVLTKSSWIILFLLWPMLWLVLLVAQAANSRFSTTIVTQYKQLLALLALALYVINSGYLFDETMCRLEEFPFISNSLGNPGEGKNVGNVFAGSWMGAIPVPLPKQFVLGLDHQKKDFEAFPYASYLRGEWRHSSWWYYYLYGFVVKTPIGLLGLVVIAAMLLTRGCPPGNIGNFAGWAALLLPGLAIVLLVSFQPTLNHHFRYVLPAHGPLFVFASSIPLLASSWSQRPRNVVLCAAAICVVSIIASAIVCAPKCISFFNAFAGGPRNGHRHMIHSNLDWGQGLYYLRLWLKERRIEQPIHLAYYGFLDPAAFEINYVPASCGPIWDSEPSSSQESSELHAISVNYIVGDRWRLTAECDYSSFRDMTPIYICGDTIYIYRVRKTNR